MTHVKKTSSTLSLAVYRLLEVMAKGAGKTSTLDIHLLAETLGAIGWSVKPTPGFARLTTHRQLDNHPVIQSWLARHRAETWGYDGVKEPKEVWFDSQESAESGYKSFPVQVSPIPSTDISDLTVHHVNSPSRSRSDRWIIWTMGWTMGVPTFTFTSKSGSEVTISMSVDYRGRIADPNKTPMPSFWTWAYKNGLQQDAQEILSSIAIVPKKPATLTDRTLDDTGTCPACMTNVKMARGRIMRHGWSVQGHRGRGQYGYSWHSGPCFGVGYEPWEVSPKGAEDYVKNLDKILANLNQLIQDLRSGTREIRNPRYDPKSFSGSRVPKTLTPSDPSYDKALRTLIDMKTMEVNQVTIEISRTDARIASWEPKPLYGKEAANHSRKGTPMPNLMQRVANRHIAAISERKSLMWASGEVDKINRRLENVHLVLTAREHSGPPYEGFESLADGDSVVSKAVENLSDAAILLAKASKALHAKGSLMPRVARSEDNALDGLDKRTGLRRINAVIAGANLDGFFRDNSWAPIHKLWKSFEKAGIIIELISANYTKDEYGNPNSKTWKFKIEWLGPNERPVVVYGQVVASGAGEVQDPLSVYDVVAYVS